MDSKSCFYKKHNLVGRWVLPSQVASVIYISSNPDVSHPGKTCPSYWTPDPDAAASALAQQDITSLYPITLASVLLL